MSSASSHPPHSSHPTQPQAQPKGILRGHKAQVHVATFIRKNQRLATGDADGHVVLWDLAIMRPRAVWRPHDNSILGLQEWLGDRIITHGRDNKLIVWKISTQDEANLSTTLPLDMGAIGGSEATTQRPDPWMLHMLHVNTMNFCTFACCPVSPSLGMSNSEELFVAVPNTLATEAIDISHLPSEQRRHTLKPATGNEQDGMVMALSLFHRNGHLHLITGYENGLAAVVREDSPASWSTIYISSPHSKPILSLDVSMDRSHFFTSSADAIIAKHIIPLKTSSSQSRRQHPQPSTRSKMTNTKHAGQQSLTIRSDGRILATGGWDGRVRVYSAKTLKELAALRWHKTGCYAVAFSRVSQDEAEPRRDYDGRSSTQGGKIHEMAIADEQHVVRDAAAAETEEENAKVREIVATGNCEDTAVVTVSRDAAAATGSCGSSVMKVPRVVESTVKERRYRAALETHWLAAGSKDGKVSLWEIY